jgi:hypothetical protein
LLTKEIQGRARNMADEKEDDLEAKLMKYFV